MKYVHKTPHCLYNISLTKIFDQEMTQEIGMLFLHHALIPGCHVTEGTTKQNKTKQTNKQIENKNLNQLVFFTIKSTKN